MLILRGSATFFIAVRAKSSCSLILPPQKLSDWSRDNENAARVLDDYVERLESILTNSNLGLVLDVEPNYSMKIYKT